MGLNSKKNKADLVIEYFRIDKTINLKFTFLLPNKNIKVFKVEEVSFDFKDVLKLKFDEFCEANDILVSKACKVIYYSNKAYTHSFLGPLKAPKFHHEVENNEMSDYFGENYSKNYDVIYHSKKISSTKKVNIAFVIAREDIRNIKMMSIFLKLKVKNIVPRSFAFFSEYNSYRNGPSVILIDNNEDTLSFMVYEKNVLVDTYMVFKAKVANTYAKQVYAYLGALKEKNRLLQENDEIIKVVVLNNDKGLFEELKEINPLNFNFSLEEKGVSYFKVNSKEGFKFTSLTKGNTLLEVVISLAVISLLIGGSYLSVFSLNNLKNRIEDDNKVNMLLENVNEEFLSEKTNNFTFIDNKLDLSTLDDSNLDKSMNYYLDANFNNVEENANPSFKVEYSINKNVLEDTNTKLTKYTLNIQSIKTTLKTHFLNESYYKVLTSLK